MIKEPRRFLAHEERLSIEAELRSTNWLADEESRIVKQDILTRYERAFQEKGYLPNDLIELRILIERDLL